MNRTIIKTKDAPSPVGTYNQGIKVNGLIYTSGQIALNPKTNKLIDGGIDLQIDQIFKNLDAICKFAGSSIGSAVKLTVFLTDITYAPLVNKQIKKWFDSDSYPARSMVEVSKLPLNSNVGIECIAIEDE
jgi:2-iminobutanoate/2-iminopropanoate deaminase|tara:strand:+ start:152 stop:541 length:390 start_codon:yes stop_codon:yes gene_type:complete